MEEVIAKRKGGLLVAYIMFIVIGLAVTVAGIILGIDEIGALVIGLTIGLVLIAIGIWQIVVYCKVPKAIIVYRDGMLYLPQGVSVSPVDITHCKVTITRQNGIANRWGKLTLKTSDGRQFIYNYVDYITDVQERLGELKSQHYDEMMREKYAAEAAAQVAAQTNSANTAAAENTKEGAPSETPEKTDDPFDL